MTIMILVTHNDRDRSERDNFAIFHLLDVENYAIFYFQNVAFLTIQRPSARAPFAYMVNPLLSLLKLFL